MPDFALDPRIEADSIAVADLPLSAVRLMRDALYPWLILVPGLCLATLSVGFYLVGQGIQNAGRPAEKAVVL